MDQFFHVSSQWRVIICKQCRHAVWPHSVVGHLKSVQHRLSTKEVLRIKQEVQEAAIIQNPAEFETIQHLDEPIPELKIYYDAWSCTVGATSHFTALTTSSMKKHCAQQHRGVRSRSTYKKPDVHHNPWVKVHCQQMFTNSHGSNYFRVGSMGS